jgi:hypothetical protein
MFWYSVGSRWRLSSGTRLSLSVTIALLSRRFNPCAVWPPIGGVMMIVIITVRIMYYDPPACLPSSLELLSSRLSSLLSGTSLLPPVFPPLWNFSPPACLPSSLELLSSLLASNLNCHCRLNLTVMTFQINGVIIEIYIEYQNGVLLPTWLTFTRSPHSAHVSERPTSEPL